MAIVHWFVALTVKSRSNLRDFAMSLSNGGLSVGEHDRPGGRPGAASTWPPVVHLSSNCDSDIVTARKTLMVVRFICPQQLVAVIMARSGGSRRCRAEL